MKVSPEDLFKLFFRRWAEERVRVKAIADGRGFHSAVEGFVFEGDGRFWISASEEDAIRALGITFEPGTVLSCEYADPREASPDDRALIESQMVCGVRIDLVTRDRIWIYELPHLTSESVV